MQNVAAYRKMFYGLTSYRGNEHLTENYLKNGSLLRQTEQKMGFNGATVVIVGVREEGHKKAIRWI